MSYTEVTISSYNATPPTDDGSTDDTNAVSWAGIKTKLGDPINTAFASVDTNVTSACATIDAAVTAANSSLSTISTNLTTALTTLNAATGTTLLFCQTNAPTGWTKVTLHNDKALRLITGGTTDGGTISFTTAFASRTLGEAMPTHTHTVAKSGSLVFNRTSWLDSISTNSTTTFTSGGNSSVQDLDTSSASFGTVTISFGGTTTSAGSGTAMDFAVQYVDVIIARK